ncbi:uncharacterized protein RSE6_00533 [Rhynchosporium secalis]|uniref:C2H2-type domain-containing protein n=1 Tax=Rhynchosporium secalis TaxID=38038 RepID=A0A1E1LVH9_RHYSE|nr:uncharacterized protein RSE6_00533 [Rhynchosporium secalis]
MFMNANMQYAHPMGGESFSSSNAASSFSDGSSEAWETSTVYTPISTPRRGSPGEAKFGSSVFSVPTPTSSPDRYVTASGFCAMNNFTQNTMTTYHEPQENYSGVLNTVSTPNQHIPRFDSYGQYLGHSMAPSFITNDGLPMNTPSLINDDMYSPVSDMSCSVPNLGNCVAPSQTTFDGFGLQSPMNPVKTLNLMIDYDCQPSEYDTGLLINTVSPGRVDYPMPEYQHHKSEQLTPSRRLSNRQMFGQSQECESPTSYHAKSEVCVDQVKKNLLAKKRAARVGVYKVSSAGFGITSNPKARFMCDWKGCTKKFARNEHQKRHYKTHLGERTLCEFCEKDFPKDRQDNILTHVRLHDDDSPTGRTKFNPGAKAFIKQRESESRNGPKSKAKRQGKTVSRIAKTRS